MILIVGLGNPGKKYEKTRHNIGFRIIDSLGFARDKNIILLKPDTFMNESGKAVQKTLAYYKIPVSNLIVIHDDIDLPFETIRISKNASSAGHKGVQSIINALQSKDFVRIRIGIQAKTGKPEDVEKFVLKKFSKAEEKIIEKIIEKAVEKIKESIFK